MVICCVRNPLDVFVSELIFFASMTHSKDINEDISTFPEWDIHIALNVRVWKRWHDQWMAIARSGRVPVYFFRFEDLLASS